MVQQDSALGSIPTAPNLGYQECEGVIDSSRMIVLTYQTNTYSVKVKRSVDCDFSCRQWQGPGRSESGSTYTFNLTQKTERKQRHAI